MAGEWLAATANANMFTYEIAPVFIMMEHTVLLKMREIIGWEKGDSILAPGGSISNMSGPTPTPSFHHHFHLLTPCTSTTSPTSSTRPTTRPTSSSSRYAVIIARHKQFPEHKEQGMRAIQAQLICYTSKHVSTPLLKSTCIASLLLIVPPSRTTR